MINIIEKTELIEPSWEVEQSRSRLNDALESPGAPILAIAGPCAPTAEQAGLLHEEAEAVAIFGRTVNRLATVNGLPVWKPRSDQESWHGEETTHPQEALELVRSTSQAFTQTALEIGLAEHIERYAHLLSFAWTGARNHDNMELKLRLASQAQTLPLGIKNGLSGEVESTLEQVELLRQERDENDGKIVLLFRGGESAKSPETWEEQYINALKLTKGQMIVDVAHGSEMAHDPELTFTKTILGQIACLEHVINLARDGHIPAGVKIESSNVPSPIDPVIPLQLAFDAIMRLRLAVASNEV